MANFHDHTLSTLEDPQPHIEEEFNQIEKYWNFTIQAGLGKHFPERLDFYRTAMDYLKQNKEAILDDMKELPSLVGLSHGDMNADNVIENSSGSLSCIDFDGVKKRGLQTFDLLQATAKSTLADDQDHLMLFLNKYYKSRNIDSPDPEKTKNAISAWMLVFSLKSMLSTDYYTFCIPKLTPEWNRENATEVLTRLEKTISKTHPKIADGSAKKSQSVARL